jgi:MmgE/PrpD N-terminal domain
VTTTDEILALAASPGAVMTVTEADVAAFRATAAAGEGGAVVRALLAVRPAGPLSGGPAWSAWLTAAAAAAGEAAAGEAAAGDAAAAGETDPDADERAAGVRRAARCAVFGAAVALAGHPGSAPPAAAVTAAVTAGLGAAAVVESGLAQWGGWSAGTVAAAIGAGVTAGLLLGLTGPRLRAAVGICATQAAGLRSAQRTDAFPLQVGKAAFNGVEAALLAQAGFTAPAEPLDGRRGLFALFGS